MAVTTTVYSREQLMQMAESVGVWHHSIDIGQGVITKGRKTSEAIARELQSLQLPDLTGKTVLDIGAFDGFYSFEAERRGAVRVVALDHFVWSLDLPNHMKYWNECVELGITPLPYNETPDWQPDKLPGKHGYDTAHKALNSNVETVVSDFMTMDLDALSTFDVVLFLGVLYHMENPLASLRRLASVTSDLAIIETHAVVIPGYEHLELCEFYSSNQLNHDVSNWWGMNLKALEGMCRAAGFSSVEVVVGYSQVNSPNKPFHQKAYSAVHQALQDFISPQARPAKQPLHFRAVVHARKKLSNPLLGAT